MNNFRKSRGLGFHFRQFLCIILSIGMVLMGLPVKSQAAPAESPIEIKIDTLQKLRAITSTLERITGILEDFKIITPKAKEKIVDTLQELRAIASALEKIMSLLEEFKTITSPVERIMYALEELKAITPSLERGMDILKELKTAKPVPVASLEKVMDTLKELKTIKPTLEKIMNTIEELKTTKEVSPDLESKISGNLASLRIITQSLNKNIGYNLSQISPVVTPAPSPAPVALKPPPVPEPTQPPPVPAAESGMGAGGAILGGVLIAGGVAALVVALAGSTEKTTSSGGGSSGCSSGYAPCGSYNVCCPDLKYYCPGKGCYSTVFSARNACSNYVVCHNKVSSLDGINYLKLRMPDSGLTLFNSNLSSGSGFFKTEFGILGACSGDDSMLNTTLGLQVKGEYSRLRGQFIFSPFIQLQNQRSGGLTEFAENNVSVYTTTLYGMDIHYVPYNLTLSSMIRQAIQSEDSESLNATVVQLTLKF